jgi:oligopeptide/dipeptide ABC transporter ATP-binding protein
MGSIPSLGARKGPLSTIPGSVPLPESMPQGCRFATLPAQSRCHDEKPPLTTLGAGHQVACFRAARTPHRPGRDRMTTPILEARDLSKLFPGPKKLFTPPGL